ncbi:hypothetical protein IA807_07670 [Listeria seeligeri]|uniref:Uncharacterized protein n=1 Tax=Listeria seeligeri FSL N1-067 TaxID=702453 RepID=E3ZL97_LISSE|nr:hypothetical protein [Listeria seeligeri]EFS01600.1 conserved hypothetical protein [Listeria seeligeri FSL N1-067]MBC2071394.1 hypothetical protein [Listeria seeligeri]MBF2354790.1 hypothetical protein [Listeria seeligeri]
MIKINYIKKLVFENQEYIFKYPIHILREYEDKNHVYVLLDIAAKQDYTLINVKEGTPEKWKL